MRRLRSSAPCGTRNGIRAWAILRFARTIRCCIVGTGTRKAAATSGVDRPPRKRNVSATWASNGSAGWQQVKNRVSRSSGSSPSGSVAVAVAVRLASAASTANRSA